MKGFEIERKWLIESVPTNRKPDTFANVTSFYLTNYPEIRYRKYSPIIGEPKSLYMKTLKSTGDIIRKEVNIEIDHDEYVKALATVRGIVDDREYYRYQDGDHVVEVSVLNDCIYCEVEFESVEDAKSYHLPDWIHVIKEVTDDPYYKMKNHYLRTVHAHIITDMDFVDMQIKEAMKELYQ